MLRRIAMVVRIALKPSTSVRAVPYDRSDAAAPYEDQGRPRIPPGNGGPRLERLGHPGADHRARIVRPGRLSCRSVSPCSGEVSSCGEWRDQLSTEHLMERSPRYPHTA